VDDGTVIFAVGGATIAGCSALPLSQVAGGEASCTTTSLPAAIRTALAGLLAPRGAHAHLGWIRRHRGFTLPTWPRQPAG
jgi:hypothetical protein